MKKRYRIAATITSYEDANAVRSCLRAIRKQSLDVEEVLIVDNSHKSAFSSDDYISSDDHIKNKTTILSCSENVGTAGALKIQVSWAIEQKFDFIWIFDQDSEPNIDCLEKLIDCYEMLLPTELPISIIAPIPIESKTNYRLHGLTFENYKLVPANPDASEKSFYTCDAVIASGSLVSVNAARIVDVPDINLFIDAVDWAYCLAFRKQNFEIVVVKNAFMRHSYASCSARKLPFFNREILIHSYSPLRRYYICRNHTHVLKENATKYFVLNVYINRIIYLITTILKIIVYEHNDKPMKVLACVLGTIDGFSGALEKRWV